MTRARPAPRSSKLVDLEPGKSPGATRAPLADWIPPTLATLVTEPPRGTDWLHEIKFDGYRILARSEAGQVRLMSRNARDWTRQFSRVATAIATLPVRRAMLDGEVVFLLPDGTTSFQEVQNALSHQSQQGLAYYAFDLLHLDDYDLTGVVLRERKRLLAALLEASDTGGVVHYTDHLFGRGPEFLLEVCQHSLEGMISKRADVPHRSGRSRDWLKIKCLQGQEFVVGGYTEGSGSRTGFGALLLGVHEKDGLRYVGRVGTGFSEASLRDMSKRFRKIERTNLPFLSVPAASRKGVHWAEPALVADVAFTGWTRDGQLRHSAFRGLRDDRPAAEVVLERAAPLSEVDAQRNARTTLQAPRQPGSSVPKAGRPSRGSASPAAASGHVRASPDSSGDSARTAPQVAGVRISNASKVLYSDVGLTKLDLARYYEMVGPWMVAHVADRPLTLVRCPDGYDAGCFFQKSAEGTPEELIGRVPIPDLKGGDESTYLYVRDVRGLVALLQMGVLEFHIWGSRAKTLELPDRITFDLDPGPSVTWEAVVEGAHDVRDALGKLGLESLVMTTGGKGLHVVVPVEPELDWVTVKEFTRALVLAMVRLRPGRYTAQLAKVKREKVIFLDYLRNGRGATAVAPYSTRARPGAPVAVPLAWEELASNIRSDTFRVQNLHERLESMGKEDPWQKAALPAQSLAKVVAAARGDGAAASPSKGRSSSRRGRS